MDDPKFMREAAKKVPEFLKQPPEPYIVHTPTAIEWLAAAIYATRIGNHSEHAPHFNELPTRLTNKWREIARQWIVEIIPLLETRVDGTQRDAAAERGKERGR